MVFPMDLLSVQYFGPISLVHLAHCSATFVVGDVSGGLPVYFVLGLGFL